ncbi:DUF3566 domain-containing protein [Nocardiopsis rhodophaea]|uniref:DUF3566 domain-containing protein n=1 Tax=Nocardiopsis rhodophaea TaxID=280238 RepID=UPI0031DE52D6
MAKSDNAQRESAAPEATDAKVDDEGATQSADEATEPAADTGTAPEAAPAPAAEADDASDANAATDTGAESRRGTDTDADEHAAPEGTDNGAASDAPADGDATVASTTSNNPTTPAESTTSTTSADDSDVNPADTATNPVAETPVETDSQQGGVPMSALQERPTAVKATASSRKAHLAVSRIEPWSVMKFSFVISLVCFIILFVAVAVTYAILSTLGVFDAMTTLLSQLADSGEGEEPMLNPASWFSPARVLGYTGLIGALNIILITALSTVGAMLYNLSADLVGGIDITLTESE